jgi:hypothetical protein
LATPLEVAAEAASRRNREPVRTVVEEWDRLGGDGRPTEEAPASLSAYADPI